MGAVNRKKGRWTASRDYPLISTDGFKYYAPCIRLVFGAACVLGQLIKKIRKERVVQVDSKLVIGPDWRLDEALWEPEDSNRLAPSRFVVARSEAAAYQEVGREIRWAA